jgi:hypothetical protein
MNTLEFYQQTYTYDTSNNLTNLSHQAKSNTWQQTLAIHPNSNRGTETQQSTNDFIKKASNRVIFVIYLG